MPLAMTVIVGICLTAVAIWAIIALIRARRRAPLVLAILGIISYLLVLKALFDFPRLPSESKGAEGSILPLVFALYLCMLGGMMAEYFYHYLDTADAKQRRFDFASFLKPFFVSPLVFVPLAASLQASNLTSSSFDVSRLMVFLVAFENGFLWRGYFTRKMAQAQ